MFHTGKRNMIYPNLKVNSNTIERVTEFNFMGVIIHSHMTWNKHINHISMNQNQNQNQNNFISETYNVSNIKINLLLMGANSWKPI